MMEREEDEASYCLYALTVQYEYRASFHANLIDSHRIRLTKESTS